MLGWHLYLLLLFFFFSGIHFPQYNNKSFQLFMIPLLFLIKEFLLQNKNHNSIQFSNIFWYPITTYFVSLLQKYHIILINTGASCEFAPQNSKLVSSFRWCKKMSASRTLETLYWHILKLIYNYFWLRGSKYAKLKSSVPNESPWLKQAWKEKEIK